jgi:polyisoprenoid-binding protein YceI
MKYGKVTIVAAMLALALPAMAHAKNWNIDYAHSQLGFIGMQGTAAFNGGFHKFQTTIDLDPAHPQTGKISTIIDMASATAGSQDRDSYLPQSDWFNTSKFPEARFESSSIRKTADNTYVADGFLTIKSFSHPVSLTFTLVPEQDHWRAKGTTKLARNDFHVGEGEWTTEAYVKNQVEVDFDIIATPQP